MGGGDLNLKKSWHPSTLRNIERVWKAEQKHEAEKQKIEQLQKELAEERAREEIQSFAEDQGVVKKRGERLDWMYQGPAALVNREEYLLGRKVDKTLELLDKQEGGKDTPKEEETHPGAIFSQSSVSTTVDLANKIREDPLFTIMKKEKEDRKTLLNNPVKMKQLQQLLKQSLSGKKKKSKKKHKKSRRDSSSSDSSSSSSSDSEDSNKIVKRQKREHQSSSRNGEKINIHGTKKEREFYEAEEKYSQGTYHNNKGSSNHFREDDHNKKESQSSRTSGHDYKSQESFDRRDYGDSENSFKRKQSRDRKSRESKRMDYDNSENSSKHKLSRDYRSRESSSRRDYDDSENLSRHKRSHDYKSRESSSRRDYDDSENSPNHKQSRDYKSRESPDRRDNDHSENLLKHKQSSDYNSRKGHDGYRNGERKEEKRKLSDEDKERLRQEMLDNAKWREEQRQRNVQRYEREDEKESKGRKGDASEFIKPMLSKAASSGSVENRIRQKIFTIQRSRGDMDRNFVRR